MLAPVPPAAIASCVVVRPSTLRKFTRVGSVGNNLPESAMRSDVGVRDVRTIQ